jgi:hypothetical protein
MGIYGGFLSHGGPPKSSKIRQWLSIDGAILWLRDPPTSGKLGEFSGWLDPVFTDAPVVGHIAHESSQKFLQDGPQDSVQLPEKSGWILSFMNVYGRYNYR